MKTQIETWSESHVYRYEKPIEVANEQFKIFWAAEELGVKNDEDDLRTNLTPAERSAICYLQSILSRYEDHLGENVWGDIIPKLFPRREIVRACSVISMVETHSHAPFYKIFNEVLNLATDDFYSQWRYDGHLYEHIKYVDKCTKSSDALTVAAATCGLEGLNLFAAFGFFKCFNTRGYNLISHFVSGIDGSAKDENFHAMFSSWLFRQCLAERKQLSLDTDYIYDVAKNIILKLVDHEMTIISHIWDFEKTTNTPIRVVKRSELEHFVRDRANMVASYLGLEPLFDGEQGEISGIFYLNVSSFKMSDFFSNTQLQYTRTWNESKLTFNNQPQG